MNIITRLTKGAEGVRHAANAEKEHHEYYE